MNSRYCWTILLAMLAAPSRAMDEGLPNIVLINCDNLGYGDVGPFGSTRHRTPNLDRMADEGMKVCQPYPLGAAALCGGRTARTGGVHCYNTSIEGCTARDSREWWRILPLSESRIVVAGTIVFT